MAVNRQQYTEKGNGWIIEYAPVLANETSIRLGGTAIARIKFSTQEALLELSELHKRLGGVITPMGYGSNIIARSGELPLTLISMDHSHHAEIIGDEGHSVLVKASAGMRLPALLSFARSEGLSGLEGLCGIPGNMGGAVAMNAGSFGTDISKVLVSLTAVTSSGEVKEYSLSELELSYRKLILPENPSWFFVSSVTLRLEKKNTDEVRAQMQHVHAQKKAVQPINVRSAGCVFKNPEGYDSAGKILDDLGFKGKRLGGMEFSPQHANFLVNTGNGTPEEAYDLIALAKEAVFSRTSLQLETEVKLWY